MLELGRFGELIMTGALVLGGVIILVVGVPLALVARRSRSRPSEERLVLLGVAGGEAEAHLWTKALRDSRVWSHIRNVGDLLTGDLTTPGGSGPHAYQYEVWVRPKDGARARKVLGL